MKTARDLSNARLVTLVEQIQGLLYLDTDSTGAEFWNPDKSWTPDTLEGMAEILAEAELVPTQATRPDWSEELNHLVVRVEQAADNALLDDLVIDLKCGEASALNNDGVEAQIQYIAWQLGVAETIRQVSDLLEIADQGQKQS